MQANTEICDLDILAVVTISTVADEEHIIPAVDPTADLWFECVAEICGIGRHFIINDNFTKCHGVAWTNSYCGPCPVPDGTVLCEMGHPSHMNLEIIKCAFDIALPTSTLITSMN